MVIINTVNDDLFTLNGIEYFKHFTSFVAGDSLQVFSAYDRCQQLINFTNYQNVIVNGVTHGDVATLQSALLPVIYSRGAGGGSGSSTNCCSKITVFGNKFDLVKHPDNNNPANVDVLELNDFIKGGFRDANEYWYSARYKTLQDKDDPINWEIQTREKNLDLT